MSIPDKDQRTAEKSRHECEVLEKKTAQAAKQSEREIRQKTFMQEMQKKVAEDKNVASAKSKQTSALKKHDEASVLMEEANTLMEEAKRKISQAKQLEVHSVSDLTVAHKQSDMATKTAIKRAASKLAKPYPKKAKPT